MARLEDIKVGQKWTYALGLAELSMQPGTFGTLRVLEVYDRHDVLYPVVGLYTPDGDKEYREGRFRAQELTELVSEG
jgi:hypothetical protein